MDNQKPCFLKQNLYKCMALRYRKLYSGFYYYYIANHT